MNDLPTLVAVSCSLLIAGCNECENGFKIKTEYTTIFWDDRWHESEKDTLLDGAVRTTTWAYKKERRLTLRCFKFLGADSLAKYDLRYEINIPLLKRIGPELEKSGPFDIVVSVDGTAVEVLKARAITHDDGISFLANLSLETIDKVSAASKDLVVMPRHKGERLDSVVEFGVVDLAKYIVPVKKACELARPSRTPAPEEPPKETKKA